MALVLTAIEDDFLVCLIEIRKTGQILLREIVQCRVCIKDNKVRLRLSCTEDCEAVCRRWSGGEGSPWYLPGLHLSEGAMHM